MTLNMCLSAYLSTKKNEKLAAVIFTRPTAPSLLRLPLRGSLDKYAVSHIFAPMQSASLYRCLCDENRLRILNLLIEGPLCVCHLAEVLEVDQPKVSRHLKALKMSGMVETERHFNWTICRIARRPLPVLEANLKCLQDLRGEEPVFKADLRRRSKIIAQLTKNRRSRTAPELEQLCQKVCVH